MPTPKKGETEDDFVSRCIPIVLDEGTAEDGAQAAAICHSLWDDSKDNRRSNMRPWYSMKKPDENTAEICIFDEIGKSWWGEETVSAKSFNDDLNALGKDVSNITLRINSPGGDVFDGIAIHNALKQHPATVTAHVDGIAASIASFIAMAADKIVMPSNAFMLIHGASGMSWGNADDMRATADDLERIDKSISATYVARSGKPAAKVRALMKEDRLMDAAEVKEFGLCDEVIEPVQMAASFSLRLLPQPAAKKFKAALGTETEPDPPPVPVSEGPEPQPVAEPAPPSPAAPVAEPPQQNVVQLNAARNEGVKQHAKYVSDVNDLCVLASLPDRAIAYIKANKTLDQVREDLMKARTAGPDILPQHPLASNGTGPQAAATGWKKIADKLNARLRV